MMLKKIHIQNLMPGDCIYEYEERGLEKQLVWLVLSNTPKGYTSVVQFARFSKYDTTIFSDASYSCNETLSCNVLLAPRKQ